MKPPPAIETEAAAELRAAAEAPANGPTVTVYDDDGDGGAKTVDALDFARKKLRLPSLRRVVQRGEVDGLNDLELSDGTLIPIGTVDDLDNPTKVRRLIAERMGPPAPPRYTRAKWDPIFDALLALRELVDGGVDPDDVTRAWIADYVVERIGADPADLDLDDPDDRRAALQVDGITGSVDPFVADECLYVYLDDLERFLRNQRRVQTSPRNLSAALGRLGFETFELRGRRAGGDGKRAGRKFKRSPIGFDFQGA